MAITTGQDELQPATPGAAIMATEHRLHERLADWRLRRGIASQIAPAAHAWSDAVWRAAVASQPLSLSAEAVTAGFALARQPVFITGAHRSGTTLVLGMLDSHPSLCALPAEGSFYTSSARRLAALDPATWQSEMGQEWLRRLANPNNQPPYWLLGRSTERHFPYVLFARQLIAWWPRMQAEFAPTTALWPLLAVMLAYAHSRMPLATCLRLQRWVDKTPTNERHMERLRAEFPAALFVHAVRAPEAVFSSRMALERRTFGAFRGRLPALEDMQLSYATAARIRRTSTAGNCQLIRYEDLLRDPGDETRRLAQFLGLAHTGSMLQPTTAGQPAQNNSSFDDRALQAGLLPPAKASSAGQLSLFDRALLHRFLAGPAAAVGYDLPTVGSFAGLLVLPWLAWHRLPRTLLRRRASPH